MSEITIYQKPSCSTCKNAMMLLKEQGVDFDAIDYYIDPIPKSVLRELLQKLGMRPIEICPTKEPRFAELAIDKGNFSDEELLDILAANPDLIQRPIVVRGQKAVLARPAENVMRLFE